MNKVIASLTNGDFTTEVIELESGYKVEQKTEEGVMHSDVVETLSQAMLLVVKGWTAEFDNGAEGPSAYSEVCNTVRAG